MRILVVALIALFMLPGFSSQPLDERTAQNSLPQSHDSMWALLGKADTKFDDVKGFYTAKIPPEIKQLAGTQVTISGFMLPLDADEHFKHFLLSKRTPTCPYCPPGEPDEIVEVFATTPTEWDDNLVTYTGTFKLINNGDFGLFFQLDQATKK